MVMPPGFRQHERRAEQFSERSRVVPNNRKTTAPLRTIRRKGTDNHVATDVHSFQYALDVCSTVFRIGKKMQSCAVVPYIVSLSWLPACNVRHDPLCLRAVRPKSGLRSSQRLFRKVENGHSF